MLLPASVFYPSFLSTLLIHASHVVYELLATPKWNVWLVQLYNSAFINWFCVRCRWHKQLGGRSLHWLAPDSCSVLLPQRRSHRQKKKQNMASCPWLNVRLMKMDLVIIIKLQEFKCGTIKQLVQYLWQITLFPWVLPDASTYLPLDTYGQYVHEMMNNFCIVLNTRCFVKCQHTVLRSIMGNAAYSDAYMQFCSVHFLSYVLI